QRIDPQNLAESRLQILRHVVGIAARATVRRANVEQSVFRIAFLRQAVESDLATIVVPKGLGKAHQFFGSCSVISSRGRISGSPFQHYGVMRMSFPGGFEVGLRLHIAGVEIGVELAKAGAAATVEIGMKYEALKAALRSFVLHRHVPF